MGLGIEKSSGDFVPFVKFNGKSGRWSAKIDGAETEIGNPTFVADFENIKTGWIEFGAVGMPPKWTQHPSLTNKLPRPSDTAKEGFRMNLYSKSAFAGSTGTGVVEMMSNSMHLVNAISALYDAYEQGVKSNPGMLPVVKCVGIETMKDKMGTNYKPKFEIDKFVARPAELQGGVQQAAQPAARPVQQAVNTVSEF